MSKMKELAEILGVEIGEEFNISGQLCEFRITDEKIEIHGKDGWSESSGTMIYDILRGRRTIIKEPWKPKKGEKYWCATYCGAISNEWRGGMLDLSYYAICNCFRTEEEADAHKAEIFARLKKIYDECKPLIGADGWQS